MVQPSLSVFVPAYNAADTLSGVIARIPDEAWPIIEAVHIINDGSTDATARVAMTIAQKYPKVRLHSLPSNQGYGQAVRQGIKLCLAGGADYIGCLHADGQYPPEQLLPFVQHMHARGIHVLQGSRHKDGGALAGGMPFYKYVAGKCLSWLENKTFGLHLTDYHSGFLVYSRTALLTVPVDRLSGYFDFDLEFIAWARSKGLTVDELPIPTRYHGEVSHLNPVRYGLRALGVMGKYVTGRYR
jgi:glycosyltransferase involved in cell wall biosynthesis